MAMTGKTETPKDARKWMRELRQQGRKLSEIARITGASLSTVHKYVYDIPAKGKRKEGWNV